MRKFAESRQGMGRRSEQPWGVQFSAVQLRCNKGLKSEVWRGTTAGNDHVPLEPITLHRAEPLCQGHVQSSGSGPAL